MAGDVDTQRSTFGFVVTFASGVVSWRSRLQMCVVLSTIEAEFIATIEDCKEMLRLKRLLSKIDDK